MNRLTHMICVSMIVCSMYGKESGAVQIGQNGLGEVLIYPYYTVNNNLNTLYSIVNTTDQAKAINVRFQEGEFGHDVLSFHVYLSAFDVWTGALAAVDSTISGHFNEPSVLHLTSDTSCAPFLTKSGQEFLPFLLDLDGSNDNLLRAREGQLKVFEMGVLTGEAAAAVDHQGVGIPSDCGLIETEWVDNGVWDLDDLDAPSGGLMGSATIVNVFEGLALPYDAIALQNFWQQSGFHAEPGSEEPNLSSAFPESKILIDNGELAVSEWANGYEAVSAVLMNTFIHNEYVLDTLVNGKSEWVVSFPTKKFHTVSDADVKAPFSRIWNGQVSCDEYELDIYDREEQLEIITTVGVGGLPRPSVPIFCYSSNVLEFVLPGMTSNVSSAVLGSNNNFQESTPANAVTESGWARLSFTNPQFRMNPSNGANLLGLPLVGFAVQQFTNAGAAEGLLAQYGSLFMHKSSSVVETGQ